MTQRIEIKVTGEIPDSKPRLHLSVFHLVEQHTMALQKGLEELGVTVVVIGERVIRPKAETATEA